MVIILVVQSLTSSSCPLSPSTVLINDWATEKAFMIAISRLIETLSPAEQRCLNSVGMVSSFAQGANLLLSVGLALKQQLLPPGETVPANESDWRVDHVVVAES